MALAALSGARCAAFVRLFDAEPELLRLVDPKDRERLTRAVTAESLTLQPGPWLTPRQLEPHSYGYMVIDGHLRRDVPMFGRRGVELLGRGDIVQPSPPTERVSVAHPSEWRALTLVRLAALDASTSAILGRIPGLGPELTARAVRRSRSLAIQLAVARIRGVALRALVMLWHLAERWGEPEEGDAVVVPVPLPHALLADLVSATRPATSNALKALVGTGQVSRGDDELWRVHGREPRDLADLVMVQRAEAELLLADPIR